MPEMAGERVCRLIKSDPALADIIIFILTAKKDLEARLTCFDLGAEEYLVKPIEFEELAIRIRRFLQFGKRHHPVSSAAESTGTLDTKQSSSPARKEVAAMKYGVYRVERLVGKGGMGEVYKAYDEQLDRYVALKVLSRQWTDSTEFVRRFQHEAKLIAAIDHPGIAQVYSLGKDQEEYYFALLWCPGGSLRDLIRNEQKIGLLKAVDIILQCARARSQQPGKKESFIVM
jgi:CheY-like chemotaxis protein